jgi:IS30 family transposase
MMLNEYRRRKKYLKIGKRQNGKSIEQLDKRILIKFKGSIWQGDTVIGTREKGKVLLTLTNVFTKQCLFSVRN